LQATREGKNEGSKEREKREEEEREPMDRRQGSKPSRAGRKVYRQQRTAETKTDQ